MNIHLTPEWAELVQAQMATGRYLSPAEVVHDALRLLEDQERLRQFKIAELRKAIDVAIEQADRGEVTILDENTAERIKARGRKWLAEQQGREGA